MFSAEYRTKAQELLDRYPVSRSALLPLLHLVQAQEGYVTEEGVAEIARLLGLTKAEVMAVATFYTMYKRSPTGRHIVSVCTNFSCKVRGAQEVYDRLSAKLGVGHNETTADGTFTLEHAECLGNCEGAPIVAIDYLNYEGVSPEEAERLLERVAAGDVPPPTRGMVPPGLRDVSYLLAGLGPARDGADAAPSAEVADVGQEPQRPASREEQRPPGDTGEPSEASLTHEARRDAADGEEQHEAAKAEAGTSPVPPDTAEEEAAQYAREAPTADSPGQTAREHRTQPVTEPAEPAAEQERDRG